MFPSLSHIKEFYYTISIINYMICLFFSTDVRQPQRIRQYFVRKC